MGLLDRLHALDPKNGSLRFSGGLISATWDKSTHLVTPSVQQGTVVLQRNGHGVNLEITPVLQPVELTLRGWRQRANAIYCASETDEYLGAVVLLSTRKPIDDYIASKWSLRAFADYLAEQEVEQELQARMHATPLGAFTFNWTAYDYTVH